MTFTLHRGEIFGIAGLLGAGRTRLLRSIFGLEPVKQGRVRVGAWTGRPQPAVAMVARRRHAQRGSQGRRPRRPLSIADNLTLSSSKDSGPAPLVLPRTPGAAAAAWIERLGIRSRGARQPVAELSGGNQQKVALARLLHHDVDVLVLDEPTRGIDVGSKAQIYALLDALVADPSRRPRAVLLVSSYLPELLGLCDRIAVMREGRSRPARPASD